MVRFLVRSGAVLALIILFSVPAISGYTGGYSVVPVSPDMLSGTPRDPVPVSFWDLSPRVMVIGLALSFFPVFLFPIEMIYLLKIFAWLGYRRLTCDPLLENENRVLIYSMIRENPGISLPAISHRTGIARTTVRYHLARLGGHKKIIAIPGGHTTLFFDNCGKYSEFEKLMIRHLRNSTTRFMLDLIATHPGISRRVIAENAGITRSSVSWHADRMCREGIIAVAKNGEESCYDLTKEATDFFLHVYPNFFSGVSASEGAMVR